MSANISLLSSSTALDGRTWRSIAYGNYNGTTPTFVAVSSANTNRIARSTNNGVNWSTVNSADASSLQSVAYGNNTFIAVADGGNRVWRSQNGGASWSSVTVVTTSNPGVTPVTTETNTRPLQVVCYGLVNGTTPTFVAMGIMSVSTNMNKDIIYSTDNGATWYYGTRLTGSANNHIFRTMTFVNNRFTAMSFASPGIITSTLNGDNTINLSSWQFTNHNTTSLNVAWAGIAHGNDTYVAVSNGNPGTVSRSTTGSASVSDWTATQTSNQPSGGIFPWFNGIAFGDGIFAAVCDGVDGTGSGLNNNANNTLFSTTTNGINWTMRPFGAGTIGTASTNAWNSIAFGNSWFVAVARTATGRNNLLLRCTTTAPTLSWSIPNKIVTDSAFTVIPTSNSGGSFTYSSSDQTTATIGATSGLITILKAGSVNMTATQSATTSFAPGTITSSLTISLANPTYSDWSIPSKNFGDSSFTINQPSSNSSGSFTYSSSNTSVATISGTTITIIGAGSTTITANQSATSSFNTGSTTAIFTVNKGNPTYFIWTIPTKKSTDSSFIVSNPQSTSDGTFTYTSSNTSVATIDSATGEITPLSVGSTTITATQSSTSNWNSGSTTALFNVFDGIPNHVIFTTTSMMTPFFM
jgi:uncharacterized protein YjdB